MQWPPSLPARGVDSVVVTNGRVAILRIFSTLVLMRSPVVHNYDDERHNECNKQEDGYCSGSDSLVHLYSPSAPEASTAPVRRTHIPWALNPYCSP
jgi:hypothetical protein